MNEEFFSNELDPELEARIVALVLGEVSDFERDQLEQLIEARPELLSLRKQLEEVHGLLSDVGSGELLGEEQGTWKLSHERRSQVLAVLDGEEENPITASVVAEKIVSRRWLRWAYSHRIAVVATSACVVVGAGLMMIPSVQMSRESARGFAEVADGKSGDSFMDGAERLHSILPEPSLRRGEKRAQTSVLPSSPALGYLGTAVEKQKAASSGEALAGLRGTLGGEVSADPLQNDFAYLPADGGVNLDVGGQLGQEGKSIQRSLSNLGDNLPTETEIRARSSLEMPGLPSPDAGQMSAGPGVDDLAGTYSDGTAGASFAEDDFGLGGGFGGGFGGGSTSSRGREETRSWFGAAGGEQIPQSQSGGRPASQDVAGARIATKQQPSSSPEPTSAPGEGVASGGLLFSADFDVALTQESAPSSVPAYGGFDGTAGSDYTLQVPDGGGTVLGGVRSESSGKAPAKGLEVPELPAMPEFGDLALNDNFSRPNQLSASADAWDKRYAVPSVQNFFVQPSVDPQTQYWESAEPTGESSADASNSGEGQGADGNPAAWGIAGRRMNSSGAQGGIAGEGFAEDFKARDFNSDQQNGSKSELAVEQEWVDESRIADFEMAFREQGRAGGATSGNGNSNGNPEQVAQLWGRQAGQAGSQGNGQIQVLALQSQLQSQLQQQQSQQQLMELSDGPSNAPGGGRDGLADSELLLGDLRGGQMEQAQNAKIRAFALQGLDASGSIVPREEQEAEIALAQERVRLGAMAQRGARARESVRKVQRELAELQAPMSGGRGSESKRSSVEGRDSDSAGRVIVDDETIASDKFAPTKKPARTSRGLSLGLEDRFAEVDEASPIVASVIPRYEGSEADIGRDGLALGKWRSKAQDSLKRLSDENGLVDQDSDGMIDSVDVDRFQAGLELSRAVPQSRFRAKQKGLEDLEKTNESLFEREFEKESEEESAPIASSGFAIVGKSLEHAAEKKGRLSVIESDKKAMTSSFRRRTLGLQKSQIPEGLGEKSAASEAFSTFSLHVSDVSFKLAFSELSQGKWPQTEKVRIEEFVNAMDYHDPLPASDEDVACRIEQTIHPFLQQRNLMRVSMRTSAQGRAANTPLRITLLLDNSGSMERPDRRQTVRRALFLLTQQLQPGDEITLISFANTPRLLAEKVTVDRANELLQRVQELPSEGGTNIEAALQLAMEKALEHQLEGAQNRIVLLTDGAVNLGDANPDGLARMVTTMRDHGIAFDAAGISAQDLNDEVLEALTRKGDGRYYLLDSMDQADTGFARQIAGALRPSAKNVKVQIEFNPQRVGNYKLLGFEKHELKKEDFRNDAVDAAEMAAEEAGVAVYQFEPKPDGQGDVGSVSVRFQDVATGEMVEQRWPIPYEPDAARVEVAAPTMRLASVSALFAAKIKGEPLGESVDLKSLASILAGLPESERNTDRVTMLQTMIELARELSP